MKTLEELGISPAPWHIEKNAGVLCAKSERYKHPIVDDCGNFENNNDERLIAAAPYIYEALYDVVAYCESTHLVPSERFGKVLAKAKAALAKAAVESEAER